MNTVSVKKEDIEQIAKLISDNRVVAFPTETVFGLGVKFGSHQALDALYELKHRDKGKAISMMIAKPEDIEKYAYVNEAAKKIIDAFMPGMITIILKKRPFIDDYFTAFLDTIGIRIPDDPFVLALLTGERQSDCKIRSRPTIETGSRPQDCQPSEMARCGALPPCRYPLPGR